MTDAPSRGVRTWLIVVAFLSGFSVMVVEMAAVRAMAPFFGASTYTWTNVIGVILAALSAGYFLGGRWVDRRPLPSTLFGTLLGGALLCLAVAVLVGPVSRGLLPAEDAVEGAVGLVYRASLAATLILFAPPVFLLGMVSPMVIRLLATPDRMGGTAGRVFASSTIGSILGTFATTFWLVPGLGSRATIAVAGAVLAVAAVVGLLMVARSSGARATAGAGGVAALLLLVGLSQAGPLKSGEGQMEEVESAYQYLRVVEVEDYFDGAPVRMLQINEAETAYQSVKKEGTVLTGGRYYNSYSILPLLLGCPEREGLRALIIGLATGTIASQLHHFYPEGLLVTGVEIDPEVLAIGRRRFDLPERADWLDVVVADGRVYLNLAPRRPTWDLVVVDAFAQEYYIPFHLATAEAFEEVKDRLTDGEILALNVAAYTAESELLRALEATLAQVFGEAWRVRVPGYPNWMVFARKTGGGDLRPWARTSARDVADWEAVREIARLAATGTVRVRQPSDGELLLTDDRAPVERLTDRAAGRESRALLSD